jgi:hypothetical protein
MFRTVIAEAVMCGHGAEALNEMVTAGAEELQQKAWAEFETIYEALTPTQRAVLDTIARLAPKYEPYATDSISAYKAVLGVEPSKSSVQGALQAMQDRELIWQAARGDYAFDDDSLQKWYLGRYPQPPNLATSSRKQRRT